jgi:hypothetical protein
MIVQRKVLKAAEVFATTVKRWSQGKNTNLRPSKKWLQLLDSREISGAPGEGFELPTLCLEGVAGKI